MRSLRQCWVVCSGAVRLAGCISESACVQFWWWLCACAAYLACWDVLWHEQ